MNRSSKHTLFVSALLMLTILLVWPLHAFSEMPSDEELQNAVDKAYEAFKDVQEGANADYIPILATVPSELFGVVIATKDGKIFSAGDIDYRFSIQSVSKPFSPRLNGPGNSIRSMGAIGLIAGELGVGLYGPNPAMAK